jgi:rhodanese-related sulfurtransferase
MLLPLVLALTHLTLAGWTPHASIKISAADLALIQTPDAIWVDAREESYYQAGHIPGALHLNRHNWQQSLGHLLESQIQDKPIIVYCSAGCHESHRVAAKLRELGLEHVQVLEGGYEAWEKTARPSSPHP